MIDSLGIIGAGNMAEAIVRSLLRARLIQPNSIVAADVSAARRELFERELNVRCVESPAQAAGEAIVLVAVKPQQMESVLREITPAVAPGALVISIAAGIPTSLIDRHLGVTNCRIVRVMPNTPLMVGAGAVAVSAGPRARASDLAIARHMFEPSAVVIEVGEDKLDAVTALSGSGPAYFYYLVEQMIAAGVANGLTGDESRALAVQTAIGSARMLAETGESAADLRSKVTSPGGTTQAAIDHLQRMRFGQIVIDAMTAAAKRARELSGA